MKCLKQKHEEGIAYIDFFMFKSMTLIILYCHITCYYVEVIFKECKLSNLTCIEKTKHWIKQCQIVQCQEYVLKKREKKKRKEDQCKLGSEYTVK